MRKTTCLYLTLLLLCAVAAPARPRAPLPLVPDFAWPLYQETFDEAYSYTTTNAQVSIGKFVFDESWAGYALQRRGANVTPFVVPGVDASGHLNLAGQGTIRFWFEPAWSSGTQAKATGPGAVATLLELDAIGKNQSANVWVLQISADGAMLALVAQSDGTPALLLQTEISWQANQSHLIVLDYGPKETALFIDGQLAAQGVGTQTVPPQMTALFVGSSLAGKAVAGGDFDELYCFGVPTTARWNRPLTATEILFYYNVYAPNAALGPISAAEIAAREKLVADRKAQRAASMSALSADGGGMEAMAMRGTYGVLSDCVTNVQVCMTNVWAGFETDGTLTVTLDVVGGTNGLIYDIFGTTNLAASSITNMPWVWVTNSPTCNTVVLTNQPGVQTFYILGTPQDSDGDGLTDAFENLVSHTNPYNPDTDGDGISDGWEVANGLNPNVDESGQSGQRFNFNYDEAGWLKTITGTRGESFTLDFEGNIERAAN